MPQTVPKTSPITSITALTSVRRRSDTYYLRSHRVGFATAAAEYSRFKYGDRVVSERYGVTLAQHVFSKTDLTGVRTVYVTSSAYKFAPPAAASLLAPFTRELAHLLKPTGIRVRPFKLFRHELTSGDYATMSAAERQAIMAKNRLSVEDGLDLAGARVIAIDDIRVTGSHEQTVERCLTHAGAASIVHAYVVRTPGGSDHPELESRLNEVSVRATDDIIGLITGSSFTLNARIVKRVLGSPASEWDGLLASIPTPIMERILYYGRVDGVAAMERYAPAYRYFTRAAQVATATGRS